MTSQELPRAKFILKKTDGSIEECYFETKFELGEVDISLYDQNNKELGHLNGFFEGRRKDSLMKAAPPSFLPKEQKQAFGGSISNYQKKQGVVFKNVGTQLIRGFFDIAKKEGFTDVVLNSVTVDKEKGSPDPFYKKLPKNLQKIDPDNIISISYKKNKFGTWFSYNLSRYNPSGPLSKVYKK